MRLQYNQVLLQVNLHLEERFRVFVFFAFQSPLSVYELHVVCYAQGKIHLLWSVEHHQSEPVPILACKLACFVDVINLVLYELVPVDVSCLWVYVQVPLIQHHGALTVRELPVTGFIIKLIDFAVIDWIHQCSDFVVVCLGYLEIELLLVIRKCLHLLMILSLLFFFGLLAY